MVDPKETKEQTKIMPRGQPSESESADKPLPPEIRSTLQAGREELALMRQQLGWPQQQTAPTQTPHASAPEKPATISNPAPPVTPAGAEKPASPMTPAGAEITAPPVKPSGIENTASPITPASAEKPPLPATPAGAEKPAPPTQKMSVAEFQQKLRNEAASASLFELLGKALASIPGIFEALKNLDPVKMLGLKNSAPEKKKLTGEKYSEEQLRQMTLDLAKNKAKVYPAQDKAVEDVATVLNLPPRDTPQQFLDSLTDSGLVFDQNLDHLQNIAPGDVLFFRKTDQNGQNLVFTCAVVTKINPLKMRIIPKDGGTPQEVIVKESSYFKNNWYGFVKTNLNAKPQP
jgi:hypothetical protein